MAKKRMAAPVKTSAQPPRRFSIEDREEIVTALQRAGVPEPDDMADAIEAKLWPVFVILKNNRLRAPTDNPSPEFNRARRQVLKTRDAFRVLAEHLERDWCGINGKLNSEVNGVATDQVAGTLALLDNLEQLTLPKSRGRPHDDDTDEMYFHLHHLVREVFAERGVALKIGTVESSGIGVLTAVLHALTGRRPTNEAFYKRIRRMQRTGTK